MYNYFSSDMWKFSYGSMSCILRRYLFRSFVMLDNENEWKNGIVVKYVCVKLNKLLVKLNILFVKFGEKILKQFNFLH